VGASLAIAALATLWLLERLVAREFFRGVLG
jgi:hypothetical protein